METKKTVCYEDFGAYGDGKHDDFDAIFKAHEYANANDLDVVCKENAVYYIGKDALNEEKPKPAAKIKTNVDFKNAKFIIDDSEITVDMPARNGSIFHIDRDYEPVVYTIENDTPNGAIKRINEMGGFKADITKLDLGIGYAAMLMVVNENKRVYIRYGANAGSGNAQTELVNVDADGNIDPTTAFLLDYDMVTKITVIRADRPLTVKGGVFVTIANRVPEDYKYYSRGMFITRASLTIDGLTYEIEGEGEHGDPYGGFLTIHQCSNVVVKNCKLQAHKYYMCVGSGGGAPVGMGTYALSIGSSNNILMKNCIQTNFFGDDGKTYREGIWGIMGSSYCKNLVYEDSILSRFDAHAGVYNAKIINSTVACFRIIGGGDIVVENSHIYGNLLFGIREDYGSTWKGNAIIKNVVLHNTRPSHIIYAYWTNHDFGYKTYLPENITIDNLSIETGDTISLFTEKFVEQSNHILDDVVDGKPNVNKTVPPKKIVIRNNKTGLKFIKPDTAFFKNTEIIEE
ncbi:MAG: hypothetical protein J6Q68_05115 [Clostridia bacterium]|nr:hypothetical protein [Clostridia bacterium]